MATAPVFAAPAHLIGQSGRRINVRSAPSLASNASNYGSAGDPVQIIDATDSNDGYRWYYVKLLSGINGWVRGDLVNVQESRGFDSF